MRARDPRAERKDIAPENGECLEDVDLASGEQNEGEGQREGHEESREGAEAHLRLLREGPQCSRREGAEGKAEKHRVETEEETYRTAEKGDVHHGEAQRHEIQGDDEDADEGKGAPREENRNEGMLKKREMKAGG